MADNIGNHYGQKNPKKRSNVVITVLDFDENAAVEYQQLRKKLRRLGTMDLKIGAIALAQKATLLTRNLRDFSQIPGLQCEDWTK